MPVIAAVTQQYIMIEYQHQYILQCIRYNQDILSTGYVTNLNLF